MRIGYGAAIGARTVILPGVTIGRFALVGAGAVVTRDVPAHGLVVGTPARLIGYVCACGRRLQENDRGLSCAHCGAAYSNPPFELLPHRLRLPTNPAAHLHSLPG